MLPASTRMLVSHQLLHAFHERIPVAAFDERDEQSGLDQRPFVFTQTCPRGDGREPCGVGPRRGLLQP